MTFVNCGSHDRIAPHAPEGGAFLKKLELPGAAPRSGPDSFQFSQPARPLAIVQTYCK